ncbi:MAG: hypothetical protein AB9836_04605 [Aminipila sp.]
MRNLFDIIEDVKDGKKPPYDELRFALLTYSSLLFFSNNDVKKLSDGDCQPFLRDFIRDENHRRMHKALNQDPMIWIGNHNPDLPECQEKRKVHQKIFEKIMKKADIDLNSTKDYVVGIDMPAKDKGSVVVFCKECRTLVYDKVFENGQGIAFYISKQCPYCNDEEKTV